MASVDDPDDARVVRDFAVGQGAMRMLGIPLELTPPPRQLLHEPGPAPERLGESCGRRSPFTVLTPSARMMVRSTAPFPAAMKGSPGYRDTRTQTARRGVPAASLLR